MSKFDAGKKLMILTLGVVFAYILFFMGLIGFMMWVVVKLLIHFGVV